MVDVSKETLEEKKARVQKIIERLRQVYPDAKCALNFSNPLELLVATILSAQCTDERVNQVTAELFQKYRSAEDYARVNLTELEEDIRSTGFFRNKARSLKALGQTLVTEHGGKVPETMEELVKLPGVGRKTANVVLGNAYCKNEGIVVDTHVKRLASRLGLSDNGNPDKIEQDLMQLVPREQWTLFGHLLIWHGRYVCHARKPKCGECVIQDLCPSAE